MSGSVLYDVPGPRAIMRNRILGVLTIVVIAALVGFVVYRFLVTGQFDADKWYVFSFTTVWSGIFTAVGATLSAFVAAAIGSLILGFVLAIGRLSDHRWVSVPVTILLELFRAIPVLILMMLLYYGLPVLGVRMEPYFAVVIALILYNGSVLAEALRAGIESLPRGQREAGFAIGLRKSGVMTLILLPQAVRAMLPVIISQLVVTLKDTALGFVITFPELLYYAKLLSSQQGRPILQAGIVIGAIYISLCLILSGVAKWVETRSRRKQKALHADAEGTGGNPALQHEVTQTEVIGLQARTDKYTGGSSGLSV